MNKRGMTLIEVVVSSVILSITVAGVLLMFSTEKASTEHTGRKTQAVDFARQKLGELKNEVRATWGGATEPLRIQDWTDFDDDQLPGEFGDPDTFNGRRQYNVEQVVGVDPDTGYKRVTVRVDWNEPTE
jgi:prepilin-type N-terminal cleavage/methylation domain-containing protein